MKAVFNLFLFFFLLSSDIISQINFDTYFIPNTLRADVILSGNDRDIMVSWGMLKKEPFWSGNRNNLIDSTGFGDFYYEVLDSASQRLIFSRGFCSLFKEWQTTLESKIMKKPFAESLVMPYPRNTVKINFYVRKEACFEPLESIFVNPSSYLISKETIRNIVAKPVINNGNFENKIDLVILSEGYRNTDMAIFYEDIQKFIQKLFETEPFKSYKNSFNIWAVESVSVDSGADIPGDHQWKNTALNTSFYTFNSERYLMPVNTHIIRDYAALVPYDYIFILVHSSKYGGGGIYNNYSVCTSGNVYSDYVFIHEFGHAFAGLADEYYSSQVAYSEFYNLEIEPWEANITTLVDFNKKWKSMVKPGITIPTPLKEEYKNCIGVFEGAGYCAKGIYRPYYECIMKSKTAVGFCPVCRLTIEKIIRSNISQ